MTIETKMTVSELQEAIKASRAKVRLHFTAKGNPAWESIYRCGKNDREVGSCRITKKEANERLAEFGLTANLVVEIEKAIEQAQADKTAAMKASGEIYTAGRNCHKLTDDEVNAIYAKAAAGEVIADNTVKFEVGKTYAEEKSVLRKFQCTLTVLKRTAQFVTFQFDDDEDYILRRKVACEFGVEKIFIHEPNMIDGDYEFSAKNVVEVKAEPATVEVEVDAAEYAISEEAFNVAIDAEIAQATAAVEVQADNTVKFEVGKTYAEEKSVLRKFQCTLTVLKRTAQFITFQFDEDEDDILRRKVTCEYGVEKIYIHETNMIDGDYEFSAKNVVEVQADTATVKVNTAETSDIAGNETITVETPAEAMTLIETVANDEFTFIRQTDKHPIIVAAEIDIDKKKGAVIIITVT